MSDTFANDEERDDDWTIEISSGVLEDAMLENQSFIDRMADAVRIRQLSNARRLPSLYGRYAQRRRPNQPPSRRIN